jgi:hypothetical protein
MRKEVLDIILSKDHFPSKLSKSEGETLKKYFKKDMKFGEENAGKKKSNELEFRYTYEEDGVKYILLEEYLFKEGESFLLLENSIGVNYYLNKV